MYVEFYNLSEDKAYYACGSIDNLVGVISNPSTIEHLVDLGTDPDMVLERIRPVLNELTDIEPGDSFQIRLFTMDPDSSILTKRIMIRGIYWPKWKAADKEFEFEKVN